MRPLFPCTLSYRQKRALPFRRIYFEEGCDGLSFDVDRHFRKTELSRPSDILLRIPALHISVPPVKSINSSCRGDVITSSTNERRQRLQIVPGLPIRPCLLPFALTLDRLLVADRWCYPCQNDAVETPWAPSAGKINDRICSVQPLLI